MKAALECRQPAGAVPIWEIEFQAWDQASGKHMILGKEFAALSPAEQEKALYANAEILLAVSDAFSFAALTVPSGYWEIAPGFPAYYWLPEEARFRRMAVLQEVGVGDRMLVGNSGGVMSMPGADQYVEFAYRLYDAPEEIDQMAEQVLRGGLEMTRRFCDLDVEQLDGLRDFGRAHHTAAGRRLPLRRTSNP